MLDLLSTPLSAMSISPKQYELYSRAAIVPRLTRMQGGSPGSPHSERAASLS